MDENWNFHQPLCLMGGLLFSTCTISGMCKNYAEDGSVIKHISTFFTEANSGDYNYNNLLSVVLDYVDVQ
ncbi:hypothetical protein MTBBW1_2000005 [Desulfamplus magnetovallimortis]|uniref:Uncharacterized protein n=1 Tax=Desulfamplus magnetovallimortis TaxID=1246637 RepID=A0A1W1HBL0_9BACT|nr:hypothetical protein MTBBW1_2000005 [Desulfamplus magnetovallimortis]